MDLVALAAPIGLFLGRIANFINSELIGRLAPANLPWGVLYANEDQLRHPSQIGFLERFTEAFQEKTVSELNSVKFDDDIDLSVFLDFKHVSKENLSRLVHFINQSSSIKSLQVAGSPNPYFTDLFFLMVASNQNLKKLEMNFKCIPQSSFT
jgi:hypothetical protein